MKFLSVQKFREGVRIELLCGKRALEYLSKTWEQAKAIGQRLSVKPVDSEAAVERLEGELANLKLRCAQLEESVFESMAKEQAGKGNVLLFQPHAAGQRPAADGRRVRKDLRRSRRMDVADGAGDRHGDEHDGHRQALINVVKVDLLEAAEHEQADVDERGARQRGRGGGDDGGNGREEHAREEEHTGGQGSQARAAAGLNAGSGLDERRDGGGTGAAPATVPMASASSASRMRGMLPSLSTMPARLAVPTRVPMVSNMSMMQNVMIRVTTVNQPICQERQSQT